MTQTPQEREDHLRELARMLYFKVEKKGSNFSLYRDMDVDAPVQHDDLTLEEAEDLLNRWKLRGFHGG